MKRQIDRFSILSPITGQFYRAEEILPDQIRRPVMIQLPPAILAKDKPAQTRFFNFLRTLLSVTGHPNIVTFLTGALTEDQPYIVFEALPSSLASLMTDAPANPADVEKLLQHIGAALAFMQGRTPPNPPLLHNDIKPANIYMDAFSNFKLGDFSIAAPIGTEATRAADTVKYAAPELLAREFGAIGAATDLYALGLIAYEMALGARLFRGQFPAVFADKSALRSGEAAPALWMQWHCSISTKPADVAELVKTFPPSLSHVISRLMSKPLDQRYARAQDMLADLKTAHTPAPAPAHAAIPTTTAPAPHTAPGRTPPRTADDSIPLAPSAAPAPPSRPIDTSIPGRTSPGVAAAIPTAPRPTAAPGPAAQNSVLFYVRLRGRQTGPFDLPTLQRQARQGQISRLHQISTDQVTWQNAAAVPEIFSG